MEIVYGPVSSWRLGRSLGIDLICREKEKVCSFDCVYCSLGKTTEKTIRRREFVDTGRIEEEFKKYMGEVEMDIVTFSGTGEPTLARNLGDAIERINKISSLPIAVLTNSSLMSRKDVRRDLSGADVVVGSLDAPNEELFGIVNRPHEEISFGETVGSMKEFGKEFEGIFSLEVMFVPQNKDYSEEIARISKEIDPDEVQINTPLRSSPVTPLASEELAEVQSSFGGIKSLSVYDSEKPEVKKVIGPEKLNRLKRSGEKE